jgi:hypothetical protein
MTIMVFLFKQPRPDVKIAEGLRKVDWLGSLLLAATSACFLVPLVRRLNTRVCSFPDDCSEFGG